MTFVISFVTLVTSAAARSRAGRCRCLYGLSGRSNRTVFH